MRDPSFWSDVVTRVLSTYAVVIFAMWWSGFIVAMVVNLEWLDLVWYWVRGLPLVAQIIVWVLFLPSMLASLRFAQIRPIGQTSDMGCSLDEIRRCFIDIGGGK